MKKVDIRNRRLFSYLRFPISISTPEPSHLVWLEQFLWPWFAKSRAAKGLDVQLTCDADNYQRMLDGIDLTDQKATECFTLDGAKAVDFRLVRSRGYSTLVHDRRMSAFYGIGRSGNVDVITDGRPNASRVATMRVLRELASVHAWTTGAILLHAAAIVIEKKVVLILGEKGVGKTTLLLELLGIPGVDFLSNDRVFLRSKGASAKVTGMPTVISIKPPTVRMHPVLRKSVREKRFYFGETLEECELRRGRGRARAKMRLDLSATQFCSVMGCRAVASGTPTAIIFPRVESNSSMFRTRRLTSDQGRARIPSGLFPLTRAEGAFLEYLAPGGLDLAGGSAAAVEALSGLPSFEWRVGGRIDSEKLRKALFDKILP